MKKMRNEIFIIRPSEQKLHSLQLNSHISAKLLLICQFWDSFGGREEEEVL